MNACLVRWMFFLLFFSHSAATVNVWFPLEAQHSQSCRGLLLPPHASQRRHSCSETYLRAGPRSDTLGWFLIRQTLILSLTLNFHSNSTQLKPLNPVLNVKLTQQLKMSQSLATFSTFSQMFKVQVNLLVFTLKQTNRLFFFFAEPVWRHAEWALCCCFSS